MWLCREIRHSAYSAKYSRCWRIPKIKALSRLQKNTMFYSIHLYHSRTDTWFTGDPQTDRRTHRRPKNNSSDLAAFNTHTHIHTHWQCPTHIHIVPITPRERTHTHKCMAGAARDSCAQARAVTHLPEMSHFSEHPEGLKASLTWLCCDLSPRGESFNAEFCSHQVVLYGDTWFLWIQVTLWRVTRTETNPCPSSPPLPRRDVVY